MIFCNTAKTCIDASYSLDENESKLQTKRGLSAQARAIAAQITNKQGEWHVIVTTAATEFGIKTPNAKCEFQDKIISFVTECFNDDTNISNRKCWNVLSIHFCS